MIWFSILKELFGFPFYDQIVCFGNVLKWIKAVTKGRSKHLWFADWGCIAISRGRVSFPATLKQQQQQQQPCTMRKKSHGKSEFSWVLADNLCVLVTTPPSSSSVPFSAHMLPIKQSNLHDVSLCIYVCVCVWEMARKSALLPRCAKKRGEMRWTGWTKKSVTTQTDDD